MITKGINRVHAFLFSETRKEQAEHFVFKVAILAFIAHLLLIGFFHAGDFSLSKGEGFSAYHLLQAIPTPFSIILIYEAYALIYYLPRSISLYLGKQYELITLILIRKLFYEFPALSVSTPLELGALKKVLFGFVSILVCCLLIFFFYKLYDKDIYHSNGLKLKSPNSFYQVSKRVLSILLFLLLIALIGWELYCWIYLSLTNQSSLDLLKEINHSLFEVFFAALILTEVLILLLSFQLTEHFHKIIRNSGFILSTVLLKLSFNAVGLSSVLVVLSAISFGVLIMGVHGLFELKLLKRTEEEDS